LSYRGRGRLERLFHTDSGAQREQWAIGTNITGFYMTYIV